jgi:hypothetical protein
MPKAGLGAVPILSLGKGRRGGESGNGGRNAAAGASPNTDQQPMEQVQYAGPKDAQLEE